MGVEKHGHAKRGRKTPLYRAWVKMHERCRDKKGKDWPDYGGRGICVCKEWYEFEAFAADMGPHPGKGFSLDREDVDGLYNKHNCRWATATEQSRNRRYVKLTPEKVDEIKARYAKGENPKVFASEYDVSWVHVYVVLRGKAWG
jgi:hypothetical protein